MDNGSQSSRPFSSQTARSRALPALLSTPLLDLLLAVVLFLLRMTSLQSGCGKQHRLIGVENARSMIEAPFVVVGANQILLDGVPAGETRALADKSRVAVIAELRDQLKTKRELWRTLNPEGASRERWCSSWTVEFQRSS